MVYTHSNKDDIQVPYKGGYAMNEQELKDNVTSAEWLPTEFEGYSSPHNPVYCEFRCSNCQGTVSGSSCLQYYKFCPYCGCKMKNVTPIGGQL